ncbi:MAG: ATP-binding protein [Bacteroidales bacterium]|nr:ATP-binding protein [Bacteroidales bacterium]
MISKNLYLNLIARVVIVAITATGFGFTLAQSNTYTLPFVLLVALIVAAINLIWYINSTNRKLNLFFEAIKNNDSALIFQADSSNKTLKNLSSRLNQVNRQIQQLKIDNQQKEQYFRTLLENVATGIITFNSKGFVLHANSAAKRMLQLEVLTHIKQMEKVDSKLFQTVQHIKPNERKLVSLPCERGVTELSLNATPFKTTTEEMILLSIQDIKNELDAKELDSWLKLIRVLMHEIMNTIAPITSLSESLSKHVAQERVASANTKSTEIVSKGLEVIRTQSVGLMQFVELYRKLTRLPKPDKKYLNAANLLNQIKLLFESDCKNGARIEVTAAPETLEVYADEGLISQVLINLVKNAIQANEGNPKAKISVIAKSKDNRVEIDVVDNGPGIPKEIIDEIFVPFFTTHENGSGIGLSISRQIVRLHGGTLKVKSIPNSETAFSFSI